MESFKEIVAANSGTEMTKDNTKELEMMIKVNSMDPISADRHHTRGRRRAHGRLKSLTTTLSTPGRDSFMREAQR